MVVPVRYYEVYSSLSCGRLTDENVCFVGLANAILGRVLRSYVGAPCRGGPCGFGPCHREITVSIAMTVNGRSSSANWTYFDDPCWAS